ncbi:zinc knuckle domain-containing protein, partial [Histoplasma capsulatum H143]
KNTLINKVKVIVKMTKIDYIIQVQNETFKNTPDKTGHALIWSGNTPNTTSEVNFKDRLQRIKKIIKENELTQNGYKVEGVAQEKGIHTGHVSITRNMGQLKRTNSRPWRGIKFVHVIIHRPLKPKIFQPVATALKAAEVISPKSEDDWAKGWGLMHISPCHCAEDRGPWTAWV